MKKLLLKIALFGSLFINLNGLSQSSACGYTTCVPAIKFSNPDLLQLYGAIIGSYSIGPTPSGTVNVRDNSNDSLNVHLQRIASFLHQAGIGSAAYLLNQDLITNTQSTAHLSNIYFNGVNGLNSVITNNTLSSSATSVTTSGTVTTGAASILFETSGDFTGTIDGLRFLGNGFLSYPSTERGKYPAIPYAVETGTLFIRKIE